MIPRIAVLAPLSIALALAQNTGADAGTGKGMYRIYCAACHGIRAEGGRGPDLTRTQRDDAGLFQIIANGSPLGEMPGYRQSLGGDENVRRVVAYLRTAARPADPPLAGDADAGEKLFWGKGGCGSCHRIGTRGGRLGPELTHTGRLRSVRHLREAITDPNQDIAPGQATIEVVTLDGRTLRGVERGYGNFSAQFLDAAETYHSFTKEEVRSMKREKKSLMPAYRFGPRELNDLIVYLQSTGRKP